MSEKTSLLQRSNMSIDKKRNLLALQRSAMSEALENDATNLVSKTLHTRERKTKNFLTFLPNFY